MLGDVEADFPALETKRLILRSFVGDDVEFLYRHFSDRQSEATDLIEFYKAQQGARSNRWCIVRKVDNKAIGTCGYHHWVPPHRRAEIGYDLSPQAWGQGYMTEALRAVLTHGFDQMKLHRTDALVFGENGKSIRLLERLGFQSEGVLRDYFCLNGVFYDHRLFALLERDWRGSESAPE
jgi:ribosomal-protein-alanine N-acetyltransferase